LRRNPFAQGRLGQEKIGSGTYHNQASQYPRCNVEPAIALSIAAGAHALAVVSALFDAEDVRLAARRFSALFAQPEPATRLS